jgi:hypothetical protein
MAPRLMTRRSRHRTVENGRSKWIKKGMPLLNNRGIPFFEYKSLISDYCFVMIISSNARLYAVLLGFFPTTVNVNG